MFSIAFPIRWQNLQELKQSHDVQYIRNESKLLDGTRKPASYTTQEQEAMKSK